MKIKDPLVLGATVGIVANLVKFVGNEFNRKILKISNVTYPEIAAGLFMAQKERKKPVGLFVGALADFAIGAMMGVPMVYILRYTGRDHATLKGLGFGNLAWVSLYGAVGRMFGIKGLFPLNASTNLSAFINHGLYGITAALLTSKLGDPSLFPEPGETLQDNKRS